MWEKVIRSDTQQKKVREKWPDLIIHEITETFDKEGEGKRDDNGGVFLREENQKASFSKRICDCT